MRCESERSQHHNLAIAKALMTSRLAAAQQTQSKRRRDSKRKNQVGSGMRGDKRRTIRVQAGKVIDHVTGRRIPVRKYLRGYVEELDLSLSG